MNNFEIYPKVNGKNLNIYGLYVVNTKKIYEVATYDLDNDELIIKDAVANSKKISFNKVVNDFIKECDKLEVLKRNAEEKCQANIE